MKKVLKVIGGAVVVVGVVMVLGTIGADDRMVMGQGAGMAWSELITRTVSGLALCGMGALAVKIGSVIR